MVRWANLFFLIILAIVALACWLIRYPDVIQASAKLTSINAPKPVVSQITSKLVKLYVLENQTVQKGQILGYVESTANQAEVLKLSKDLDSVESFFYANQSERLQLYFKNRYTQLGELQPFYQVFSQSFVTFSNYLLDGFYVKKKIILTSDMKNLEQLHANLISQKTLQQQDLALSQKTFDANELLKNNKVISDFDYRSEQSKLIVKKLTLPQINSTIISNENLQNEKQKEMLELDNTIEQQRSIFQQALYTFKSHVDDWKKKYLLIAPIEGKVAFSSFFQENQQLQANQSICFIHPENSQYFAEVVIPQANFGKVLVGQQVLLKFSSYPFQEFGSVNGKIEFISKIPTDSGYLAKVSLNRGLTTTNKRQIQYREGLTGKAEIITKDMRLLERFYINATVNLDSHQQ